MKKNYVFVYLFFLISVVSYSQFTINEIDYYTQQIEISGPAGASLNGWSLTFYKGNGQLKGTQSLDGLTMPATIVANGNSLLGVSSPNLVYSSPPGGAIVLYSGTTIVQFFNFANTGTFTLGGVTSINIGTAVTGESLQFTDTGWVSGTPSIGSINGGQSTLSVVKNEIVGFALYPNPVVSGKFTISTPDSAEKLTEIYALNGTLVYQSKIQSNEVIDITNLNKGIYIVKVKEEGKIATRKLIVE